MTRSEVARRVPEGTEVRGWALTCAPPDTRDARGAAGRASLSGADCWGKKNFTNNKTLSQKEFYSKTPSHDTGHGTGAHWH